MADQVGITAKRATAVTQTMNPVLLSIDTLTCRVRRYVGNRQTLNVRFNAMVTLSDVERLLHNPRTFLMEDCTGYDPEAA